jgi:protein NUD1
MVSQPAWQTDELKDEWPDELDDSSAPHTRSISLTVPVGSLHTSNHSGRALNERAAVEDVPGTFLIRGDALPVLPQKTPGQRKGLVRDFFSPIPLERMFDPPSPRLPARNPSSHLSQPSSVPSPSTISRISGQNELERRDAPNAPDVATIDDWRPHIHCRFTFTVPNPVTSTDIASPGSTRVKNAASPTAPLTDPRLRLFQFQYDTFTRDHLSAMVDSIAINSPSGSNTGHFAVNTSTPSGLPSVSDASARSSSSELRSAKRVKLSPAGDFNGLNSHTRCSVKRPVWRKDYVGESRSFMALIKNARDFSFLSTTPSTSSVPYPDPKDHLSSKKGMEDECKSSPLVCISSH